MLSSNITWISNCVIDASFESRPKARSIQFMVIERVCRRCWKVWAVKVEHFVILKRWEKIFERWFIDVHYQKRSWNLYRMHICYVDVAYLCATIIPRTANKSPQPLKEESISHLYLFKFWGLLWGHWDREKFLICSCRNWLTRLLPTG